MVCGCVFLFYFLHKRKVIRQDISSVSLRVDEKYSGNVFKDIALSKHTEQILVLLPREITQKLHDIVVT